MADKSYLPALRFERLTPLFDPIVRVTTREGTFKRKLLDQAQLRPGQRVLDLGCGTGTLAIAALRREPGIEMTGLDADPAIIAQARRKAALAGLEVRLDVGMADELPYEDATFDRVLSTLFFHHLTPEVKAATARQVARVLRPGGELHVADWGLPADPLARLASLGIRAFDGDEPTRDNLAGRLPRFVQAAGLVEIREHWALRTPFGTLRSFSGLAPG
jgi:ubiquinone/menaquinone biosynthesis C-methylase UbiE